MSFSHLSSVGTLSYNGYTFDGAANVEVTVEFVTDDAKRTIIYSRHTIEVHTFIQDDASTDAQLETVRDKLSHQGAALTFINKGFGDNLIVNAAAYGGVRDVKWGPIPEMLHWKPVGSASSCEIIWKVTTCVPVCGTGTTMALRTAGVMAFNYGVVITIDTRGMSTRTISGYLEIAQTRNIKNIPDSADNYKNLIQPDLPDSFQREQQWDISPDKSRVTFTITDRQVPSKNPYPQLVTRINGKHRARWSRHRGEAMNIRNSISLEVELALGAPQVLAWRLFGGLVKARVDYATQRGLVAFLDDVEAEEDIFGLSYSFQASYRLLMNAGQAQNDSANTTPNVNPGNFDFSNTGMWQPVGTDWRYWKASLSHVFGNRGLAGLGVPQQNDVIVDLCGAGVTIPWNGQQPPNVVPVKLLSPVIQNKKPPPRQSFISYKQRVLIRRQKFAARHKKLQASNLDGGKTDPFATAAMNFTGSAPSSGGASAVTPDEFSTSGPASYEVAYVGSAERVGYEIPRPSVQSVGGQTPVENDSTYIMEQCGNAFGVPIFKAQWAISYFLPSAPSTVSGPPNLEA